jgi:ABC-type uncharacterized transport system permease subunit
MKKRGVVNVIASMVSIFVGLLVGYALLVIFNPSASTNGLVNILTSGFRSADKFAKVLYTAAPLLMTGLSVGFAFRTGLFNIGASGQYTMGAFFALVAAIQFGMPWYVCIPAAMLGGAVWGAFPGIFKAFFNVNEVITSIMFNWIALFAVNLSINNMPIMLANYWGASYKNKTVALANANKAAVLPKLGLDELMGSNYMNIGIFIALGIAVIVWIVLSKTTFGYELKACGYNRSASQYAGISPKRSIILSMVISGALAGAGGALYYLSGTAQYVIEKMLLVAGFNGIPVALLASSNPLGIIFSALFISYIQVGGDALQPEFAKEIIDIIIAAIIYLSAFSLLMREIITKVLEAKRRRRAEAKGGSPE